MKVKNFTNTDTLYIQLKDRVAVATTELNDNVFVDLDRDGNVGDLRSNTP